MAETVLACVDRSVPRRLISHDWDVDPQTVPLRRWRLRSFARVRIAVWVPLSGFWGLLAIFLGVDSSLVLTRIAWFAAGVFAVAAAACSIIPLVTPRTPGQLSLSDNGVQVRSPAFLRHELSIPWSHIERISTSPVGDGTVFDAGLVEPTLVLTLHPEAQRLPGVRLRWTVLVAVVGVRSNDAWPPPSRFLAQEKIAFNLDCDPCVAQDLANRWDATLARHTEDGQHSSTHRPGPEPE